MNTTNMATLSHLNKPQKRALILRDQLRFKDPQHLDSFLDGISNPEPPHYFKTNGKIQPSLTEVTLNECATRYDLGNVIFPNENNAVYRAYLTVESDRFEMRTEKPLPRDDADLDSVPIHCFIAKSIIPLFKEKFEAIFTRKTAINEARRLAYKMPNVPAARFQEGETLARLESQKTCQTRDLSQSRKSNKRKPGEPIIKHPTNKRKRIGIDTIPDNVKSETFNTIPDQIKIGLFNTMVKTAFPNFDNLMMASWNVISVYSNVGSEFPELHKAIVDLKAVLDEFEAACGTKGPKTAGCEKLEMRKDFATTQQDGLKPPPKPEALRETVEPAASLTSSPTSQPQTYIDVPVQRSDSDEVTAREQMPPPPILQLSQHPHQNEAHRGGDDVEEDEDEEEDWRLAARLDCRRDTLHVQSSPRKSSSMSGSAHSSPRSKPAQLPRERVKKPRSLEKDSRDIEITPELSRKRQEYLSSISATNRNSAGAAKARQSSAEESDGDDEQPDGDGNVMAAPFLGNSMLGAKKSNGAAPMALMLHMRKDSNSMNGNDIGAGRRGH